MKKTLAIVLAVLMAVAALSSFAFIVGSNEVKDDFELLNIYAVDIDLTKSGLTPYMEVVASKDYWTPGKSLAIAVEFRVWNRTLDGHAGATPLTGPYTVAVTSDTADLSFVEYAVVKVASYVETNRVKNLSFVAPFPNGTVAYDRASDAGLFTVEIVPQVLNTNVLNQSIARIVTVKGYVPGFNAATGAITVPVLNFGADPEFVDYTVFLSAKHLIPSPDDGLGHLAACFALSWGDSWVSLLDYAVPGTTWPAIGVYNQANVDFVNGVFGIAAGAAMPAAPVPNPLALNSYYKNETTGAVGTGTVSAADPGMPLYTAYLDLTGAGYLVLRADFHFTTDAASARKGAVVHLVRYDVFKYTPELRKGDIHYVGSYVTENLLTVPGANAVHFEYNGGIVTFDMTGSYILSSAQVAGTVPAGFVPAANNPLLARWVVTAPKLSFSNLAEAKEIAELTKLHADFGTGIGQAQGYPILDNQFTALAAAAKFSTPITNTYLAGQTAAIVADVTDEDTTAGEEVTGDDLPADDVDLAPAGDATIAFVCAAAAILACAALAFVMKKAR